MVKRIIRSLLSITVVIISIWLTYYSKEESGRIVYISLGIMAVLGYYYYHKTNSEHLYWSGYIVFYGTVMAFLTTYYNISVNILFMLPIGIAMIYYIYLIYKKYK